MCEELIIGRVKQAVLDYDLEGARRVAEEAVRAGIDPAKAIKQGLAAGIKEAGERFHRYEIFLPEMVLASDAMMEALKVFEAALPKEKMRLLRKGTIVIGTVEGDLHDLGKNVVAVMLKAGGFEVHDLGKDVKTDIFIQKARDVDADIIGVSSLMSTTMPYQRELIEELTRLGLRERFKVIVGGGPVTKEWADRIGADGYGRDASEAVKEAERLMALKQEGDRL